jgi:hypothetical protein
VLVIAVEGGVGVAAETKDGINTATNAAATIRDINSFFISLLNSFLNFFFLVMCFVGMPYWLFPGRSPPQLLVVTIASPFRAVLRVELSVPVAP